VRLLIGRVHAITAKLFILLKQTYDYDVKNMSTQDSKGLHVIFNEDVSSASYLLGTHGSIFFCEFLYSFYISFFIHKSSILQLEIPGNSGIVFYSLSNKGVINLIFAC
jgi:hypothetical protein